MTATVTAEQHRQKGNICFERKQYEEALCHYTEAIKLDPNNHIYYSNRSSCYYYLKKYEYALEDAYKSIQLCPSWSKGHFKAAVALFELSQFRRALHELKMFVSSLSAEILLQSSLNISFICMFHLSFRLLAVSNLNRTTCIIAINKILLNKDILGTTMKK
jgi:tetratricopeptide (TPR) repeat protein